MASKAIEAGRAFLRLLVDEKQFSPQLSAAERKLNAFGKSALSLGAKIGAAGAALSAPFIASIKIFADVGSSLNDMAARTGLTVKSLSEFKFAADQTGTSLSDFENGIRRMQRSINDAATGSKEAKDALDQIGVSLDSLTGLSPDEQFTRISKAIGAIPDPTQRAAAAMEIFGRSGTALLPMIAQTEELRQKARELGLVWTDDMAEAADNLGDLMDILKAQFVSVAAAIGEALAPSLSRLLETLSRGVRVLIDFARENKTLVQVSAALAFSLAGLGTAIAAFGVAAQTAAFSIAGLNLALTFLSRHPYLIAITVAATAITAAAVAFGLFRDAADESNDAVKDHAALQREMAAGIQAGTSAIEGQTEALTLQERAVRALQSANEAAHLRREEDRIRRAAAGPQITDALTSAFTFGFGRPFGLFGGASVAKDETLTNKLAPLGRGRRGFESRPQLIDELLGGRGALSTFSGRLAPQIFGGGQGDPVVKKLEKLIEQSKQEVERLKSIDQKLNLGPGFRAGLA